MTNVVLPNEETIINLTRIAKFGNIDNIPLNKVKTLLRDHMRYVPTTLYKYYPCFNNRLETISKNRIWASKASRFETNDGLLEFDKHKLIKYVYDEKEEFLLDIIKKDKLVTNTNLIRRYKHYCLDNNHHLNQSKENELFSNCEEYSEMFILIWLIRKYRNDYCLLSNCREHYREFQYGGRNKSNISCFSEIPDNKYMWENYADNFKGFCVQYSFKNYYSFDIDITRDLLSLDKVIYSDKPVVDPIFLFPRLRNKKWRISQDNILMNSQFLYKKKSFASEREWRIIYKRSKMADIYNPYGEEYYFPFANKIYLGSKMQKEFRNKVEATADSLGIFVEEFKS
jgi:hypothetical protein